MPTATDLVTDLPADFEVFGQAVATSMADLLGGASGYILSKNSATDMDFVWIANDQGDITGITATSPLTGGGSSGAITVGIQDGTTAQKGAVQLENSTSSTSTTTAAVPASVKSAYDLANGAIAKSLVDAKGDLIAATAADTTARLAVGADYAFLGALASESTGLKWNSTWTTYTPTISGVTVGNGTVTAKYQRIGKTCITRVDFFLGSTSSVTGDFNFDLPFSPATSTRVVGFGLMFASIGVVPAVPEVSGSQLYLRASLANGTYVLGQATNATTPGTWAANNWVAATAIYEVA
jgi:hypothetical protein